VAFPWLQRGGAYSFTVNDYGIREQEGFADAVRQFSSRCGSELDT